MARCRIVAPETVRVALSDGDWVEVKKRLTYGETKAAQAAVIEDIRENGRIKPKFEVLETALTAAYLVAWSLVDLAGKPIPISPGNVAGITQRLGDLDAETVREIVDAVSAHVAQMEAERDAEKNGTAGASASPATLQSVA